MDKRVQQKKTQPGTGVDVSSPRTDRKPTRTPDMESALLGARKESQDFLTGVLSLRLEKELLDKLMKQANAKGLSAGQLARSWIIERLNQPARSSFSADQRAELTSIVREVAAETLREMNRPDEAH